MESIISLIFLLIGSLDKMVNNNIQCRFGFLHQLAGNILADDKNFQPYGVPVEFRMNSIKRALQGLDSQTNCEIKVTVNEARGVIDVKVAGFGPFEMAIIEHLMIGEMNKHERGRVMISRHEEVYDFSFYEVPKNWINAAKLLDDRFPAKRFRMPDWT